MNKQTKQDLKNIGMTAVVVNGQRRKDIISNKTVVGLRGGEYGPYTVTDAWRVRNTEVRNNIEDIMIRNGYAELTFEGTEISFQNGKEIVKFYLIPYSRNNQETLVFWWVLV